MRMIEASVAGRSAGWNKKTRAVLSGTRASFHIPERQPVFYIYVDEGVFAASPKEFVLAEMEIRSKKMVRRLVVGRTDFFGGKKSGHISGSVVPINTEKIADKIYKITPVAPLEAGEYCFIRTRDASHEALKSGRVKLYDLGID